MCPRKNRKQRAQTTIDAAQLGLTVAKRERLVDYELINVENLLELIFTLLELRFRFEKRKYERADANIREKQDIEADVRRQNLQKLKIVKRRLNSKRSLARLDRPLRPCSLFGRRLVVALDLLVDLAASKRRLFPSKAFHVFCKRSRARCLIEKFACDMIDRPPDFKPFNQPHCAQTNKNCRFHYAVAVNVRMQPVSRPTSQPTSILFTRNKRRVSRVAKLARGWQRRRRGWRRRRRDNRLQTELKAARREASQRAERRRRAHATSAR